MIECDIHFFNCMIVASIHRSGNFLLGNCIVYLWVLLGYSDFLTLFDKFEPLLFLTHAVLPKSTNPATLSTGEASREKGTNNMGIRTYPMFWLSAFAYPKQRLSGLAVWTYRRSQNKAVKNGQQACFFVFFTAAGPSPPTLAARCILACPHTPKWMSPLRTGPCRT